MKTKKEFDRSNDNNEIDYDKNVDFYFSNLINSLILFSFTTTELKDLVGPTFDPIFELESEIDYAFTPICFETVFKIGLIDKKFKQDLLDFKNYVDNIPSEIWDWEFIDNHKTWINVREKANNILDKLEIQNRTYNDDYETVYDSEGNILKKGKNFS